MAALEGSRPATAFAAVAMALAFAAAAEPSNRPIDPANEAESSRASIETASRVFRYDLSELRRPLGSRSLERMLVPGSRHILPDGRQLDVTSFLAAGGSNGLPEAVGQHIELLGGNAAVETGTLRDKTSLRGERYTFVWQLQKGEWRVASSHRTAIVAERALTRTPSDEDTDSIVEAVLRHHIASYSGRPYEPDLWCIQVEARGDGLDARVAARLVDVGRPVVASVQCRGLTSNVPGERNKVVLLRLRAVLVNEDDVAEAEFSRYAGPLDGAGGLYKLRRIDGRWVVQQYLGRWVS